LRESFYDSCVTNDHKSLRRNAEGEPQSDKVRRLDDFFCGWRASQIDADSIRKIYEAAQARGLENATINRSISALRTMFNLAREDRRIRFLPHFPMLRESAPRQGFFEADQYAALYPSLPDCLNLRLSIGYFTGMRLEEILSLRWEQVDFLNNQIHLRAGETKNDDSRTSR
jgi:integrase